MTYETWTIRYPNVVDDDIEWRDFDIQDIVSRINASLRGVCLVRDTNGVPVSLRDAFVDCICESMGDDIDSFQPFIDINQYEDDTVVIEFLKLYDFDTDDHERQYIGLVSDSFVSMTCTLKGRTCSMGDFFVSSTVFLDSSRKEIVLPKISAIQQVSGRSVSRDVIERLDSLYTDEVRKRYSSSIPDPFFEPSVHRLEYIVNM
jgi:hypothetical protein